jgi:hypothetical protein
MDYRDLAFEANEFVNGEEDCDIIANLADDSGVDVEVAACFAEDAGYLVHDGWIVRKPRPDYLSYGL